MRPAHSLSIVLLTAAATLTSYSTQADSQLGQRSDDHLAVYAQLSLAQQVVEDGQETTKALVDNTHMGSVFGATYNYRLDDGQFDFRFESTFGIRYSIEVSQEETPPAFGWEKATGLRHFDFSYLNYQYGRLSIGQGSTSTDNFSEMAYNNNFLTNHSNLNNFAGSFQFRRKDGQLSEVRVYNAFSNFDGERYGRLRYDSPSFFNGFSLSTSVGEDILNSSNNDKISDLVVNYTHSHDGFKLKGGLGVSRRTLGGQEHDDLMATVALQTTNGVNLLAAAGRRDQDGRFLYAQAGIEKEIWEVGLTSLAVDYYSANDIGLNGRNSRSLGFGLSQLLSEFNTHLYVGYRRFDIDEPGVSYHALDGILIGARIYCGL